MVLYLLHPTKDVFKASIIGRKESLGVVHPNPREEWITQSRESLLADIKTFLAGYVAEKIKFGTTSNGVATDFRNAMATAHSMVWNLGMSSLGLVGDYGLYGATNHALELSENMKEKLNKETQDILQKCLKDVDELLKKEWQITEYIAKELLAKEELEYDEIDAIFKDYGKVQTKS